MQQPIAMRYSAFPARLAGIVGERAGPAAIAAVFAVSLLLRRNGLTPDVAWLTDMCLRMLDGERGWVDIFETTPPVPTLLYMPGAWLTHAFGIDPQFAQFALAYLVAALVVFFAREILAPSGARRAVDFSFTLPASAALLIFSNDAFAQREWYAALFTLPIAGVFVVQAERGAWPIMGARAVAALLAGLSFAIKPPLFALPFIVLAGVELARTRRLDFLFPSMLPVAALFGVFLTALTLAAFPYLEQLGPLMRDVYVPSRLPLADALADVFIAVAPMTIIAAFASKASRAPAAAIYAALAAAHVALYLAQGKFFAYHIQPAMVFALLSLCASISALGGPARAHALVAALILASGGAAIGLDDGRAPRARHEWAAGLTHPTMMAISPYISTGFPLVLDVGGRWIDRIHGQWVVNYTKYETENLRLSPERLIEVKKWRESEVARTIRLVKEKKPDFVLQFGGSSWLTDEFLKADPTLLNDYERVAIEGPTIILRRRDLAK